MKPIFEAVPAPVVEPGTRAFIVGNGKSLKPDQLDMLHKHNEVCFGVNRIHLMYDRTKWRPTYCTMIEMGGTKEYVHDIPIHAKQGYLYYVRCDIVARCIATWLWTISNEEMLEMMNGVVPVHAVNNIDWEKRETRDPWVDGKYNQGGSVAAAQQLALAWGYNPVYLIGCEGGYRSNASNHFDPSYRIEERTTDHMAMLNDQMDVVDEIVLREYAARNVKIYNATVGEVMRLTYPLVDFWGLFE
jgi:hypothetical protein